MPKRTCGNCRFMAGRHHRPAQILPDGTQISEAVDAGWCHRSLPTMSADLSTASHRPVNLEHWCGEWRWNVPWWVRVPFWGVMTLFAGWAIGTVMRIMLNSH